MAGNRRVRGVGEADLGQSDATTTQRLVVRRRAGRNPSTRTFLSSSRVSSVLIDPPMTLDPRPSTVTGAAFFFKSVNRVSLAVRQAYPRPTRWPASSPSIPWGNELATA